MSTLTATSNLTAVTSLAFWPFAWWKKCAATFYYCGMFQPANLLQQTLRQKCVFNSSNESQLKQRSRNTCSVIIIIVFSSKACYTNFILAMLSLAPYSIHYKKYGWRPCFYLEVRLGVWTRYCKTSWYD